MEIHSLKSQFLELKQKNTTLNPKPEKDVKLKQSAKDLEGLFLSFVLKSMEKTIPSEEGKSNTLANMMFSTVMGQSIADGGGLGLQEFFYGSLSKKSVEQLENLKAQSHSPTINDIKLGGLSND